MVRHRDGKRQINSLLGDEVFDRIARAAQKVGMSRSTYAAAFLTANIDVIDPEGATPQVQDQ